MNASGHSRGRGPTGPLPPTLAAPTHLSDGHLESFWPAHSPRRPQQGAWQVPGLFWPVTLTCSMTSVGQAPLVPLGPLPALSL